MKRDRIVYWLCTGVIAAVMLASALTFAFGASQRDAFRHLGLPDWFRAELTAAKILGVIALVAPGVPARAREFAYAGFAIVLVSADIAHLASGDSAWLVLPHATLFGLLAASYAGFRKRAAADGTAARV